MDWKWNGIVSIAMDWKSSQFRFYMPNCLPQLINILGRFPIVSIFGIRNVEYPAKFVTEIHAISYPIFV